MFDVSRPKQLIVMPLFQRLRKEGTIFEDIVLKVKPTQRDMKKQDYTYEDEWVGVLKLKRSNFVKCEG